MAILIIDDSQHIHMQLKVFLNAGGYTNLHFSSSADEAFDFLGISSPFKNAPDVDVILMDIEMGGTSGIEATRYIKNTEALQGIPIIMITADTSEESLQAAFDAGAVDYINKPLRKVELLARVRSFLQLKQEIDTRKAKEQELTAMTQALEKTNAKLQEVNEKLSQIALSDGLTSVANRRFFDDFLAKEWRRAIRLHSPLSLLMLDVDFFKKFNDFYGHLKGDECLKKVAACMQSVLKRPMDLIARYGGEEFCVLLPDTDSKGAALLGREILDAVEGLQIPHAESEIADHVTVSIGVACQVPSPEGTSTDLIKTADQALYRAKESGRNRLEYHSGCHDDK